MKGWLDNFGKADNANESKVSMSEDFVGLGYNTKGRNYSPAWGGQFQKGGQLTPVSPFQQIQQAVQPTPTVPYLQTKDPREFYKSWIESPEYKQRLKATGYGDLPDKWLDGKDVGGVDYTKQQRLDLLENIQPFEYNKYKKSEAKPFDVGGPTININPLDYEGSARQSIEAHEIAHVGTPTMSYQESEIIKNAMLPMKEPVLSGVQGSKERDASRRALEDFKHLQDPDEAKADLDALRFMMYDKGIYDITKGQKFTETDFEKAKQNLGKDRVFKRLTDRMGKKNFVKLMNTIASADQEEAPIAMGGMSIPGSVGFSYARVAGAAPSKGKYAKKTMASAQNGQEMKFYQNGLDWKPKSMQDGGEEDLLKKATDFVSEGISGPVTTAALALVNMLKPISNPEIYKTVRPVGYPNALKLPVHAYNYLMGNESEPLKTKSGKPHLAEEFWATAMNIPVEKQYLKESKYKPSKSKDPNAKYYTIRDVIDDYQLMSLTKDLKPGEKMEMNGLSPILDTKWYSQNATTDKGVNFDEIDPLQRYTLEKSPDGSYVSIYDKYDFNNPALNKMMKPIEIYDRFYLPKKKYGGSVNDKKNPKENKDVDTVSISDPRYPELYRNRQVGLKYDDAISLPDLDEVTITAPRSYSTKSLRDFTSAALYGAPAAAMKIEAIPQAAMTEAIEMLRGRPYDFSNVNPNIGSFSSNQRDLSQTLGYENPEGFLQNAVNFGLSAIDPLIVSGASKVAGKQLGKKAIKAVDLDDVAKRKIHLQKLKDEKLIHPDTDINKYSKSLSDTEELTKKALTQRETYYRGVTPKIPEGPEQQLIIEEMTKAGVDISNPEEVGRYMATHVPLQKLDYNAGFQTSNPRHNALYTSGGFSRYGDMTFEMTRPLDFSKGSYSNWLDDLYKYPVYNPSEKIDDLSPFTRAYALENRPGPGVFVGTKGQRIFDNARLVTDDYGRIKSRPLPGLEDAGTINQQGSGSFLQGLINSRMIQNYNPLNLKTNSALDWSKKWYADPITIEKRARAIPKYNQEDKALSLLDQYEPKNYFDLLKEQGLRDYIEHSLTSAGVSYGKPNQIYVNRSRFIPFNRQRLESVRTHELSHLINDNDYDLRPGETDSLVKPFGFIDASDRIEKLQFSPTTLTNKEIENISRYTEPGEIKARMDQVRFDLDLTPSDKFTSEMFDKTLKKNNFYGMGNYIKDKKAFIDLMNNFWAAPAVGVAVGAQAVDQQKNGGITKDNQGYWNPDNWGKPVEIDSNNITMEGVYEPLLGISDTGDTKLMQPGKNYKFKGKKVTEFPVAKLGINQLDAQPMKKLNQLLNFTNNPDKDNWLDKYN